MDFSAVTQDLYQQNRVCPDYAEYAGTKGYLKVFK